MQCTPLSLPRSAQKPAPFGEIIIHALKCDIRYTGDHDSARFHIVLLIHASFLYLLRENTGDLAVKFFVQKLCSFLNAQEPIDGSESPIKRIYESYSTEELLFLRGLMASRYLVAGLEARSCDAHDLAFITEMTETLPIPESLCTVHRALLICLSPNFSDDVLATLSKTENDCSLQVLTCLAELIAAWEAFAMNPGMLTKLFMVLKGRVSELRTWLKYLLEQDLPQTALRLIDQYIREDGEMSPLSDLLEQTLQQLGLHEDANSLRYLASEASWDHEAADEEAVEKWSLSNDCYTDGVLATPANHSRCRQAVEMLRGMYGSVNFESSSTVAARDVVKESSILFLRSCKKFLGFNEEFSEKVAFKLIKTLRRDPQRNELINAILPIMSPGGWRRQLLLAIERSNQGQFTDLAGHILSRAADACNTLEERAKVQHPSVRHRQPFRFIARSSSTSQSLASSRITQYDHFLRNASSLIQSTLDIVLLSFLLVMPEFI